MATSAGQSRATARGVSVDRVRLNGLDLQAGKRAVGLIHGLYAFGIHLRLLAVLRPLMALRPLQCLPRAVRPDLRKLRIAYHAGKDELCR